MTIEERLVHDCGLTDDPMLGVWMLRDGSLVNGSIGGHQRDRDHREIGYYYKRSKFEESGSAGIYILKFMRRGNVRWSCNEFGFCMELAGMPSERQYHRICRYMAIARAACIETYVERRRTLHESTHTDFRGFQEHIRRYANFPA